MDKKSFSKLSFLLNNNFKKDIKGFIKLINDSELHQGYLVWSFLLSFLAINNNNNSNYSLTSKISKPLLTSVTTRLLNNNINILSKNYGMRTKNVDAKNYKICTIENLTTKNNACYYYSTVNNNVISNTITNQSRCTSTIPSSFCVEEIDNYDVSSSSTSSSGSSSNNNKFRERFNPIDDCIFGNDEDSVFCNEIHDREEFHQSIIAGDNCNSLLIDEEDFIDTENGVCMNSSIKEKTNKNGKKNSNKIKKNNGEEQISLESLDLSDDNFSIFSKNSPFDDIEFEKLSEEDHDEDNNEIDGDNFDDSLSRSSKNNENKNIFSSFEALQKRQRDLEEKDLFDIDTSNNKPNGSDENDDNFWKDKDVENKNIPDIKKGEVDNCDKIIKIDIDDILEDDKSNSEEGVGALSNVKFPALVIGIPNGKKKEESDGLSKINLLKEFAKEKHKLEVEIDISGKKYSSTETEVGNHAVKNYENVNKEDKKEAEIKINNNSKNAIKGIGNDIDNNIKDNGSDIIPKNSFPSTSSPETSPSQTSSSALDVSMPFISLVPDHIRQMKPRRLMMRPLCRGFVSYWGIDSGLIVPEDEYYRQKQESYLSKASVISNRASSVVVPFGWGNDPINSKRNGSTTRSSGSVSSRDLIDRFNRYKSQGSGGGRAGCSSSSSSSSNGDSRESIFVSNQDVAFTDRKFLPKVFHSLFIWAPVEFDIVSDSYHGRRAVNVCAPGGYTINAGPCVSIAKVTDESFFSDQRRERHDGRKGFINSHNDNSSGYSRSIVSSAKANGHSTTPMDQKCLCTIDSFAKGSTNITHNKTPNATFRADFYTKSSTDRRKIERLSISTSTISHSGSRINSSSISNGHNTDINNKDNTKDNKTQLYKMTNTPCISYLPTPRTSPPFTGSFNSTYRNGVDREEGEDEEEVSSIRRQSGRSMMTTSTILSNVDNKRASSGTVLGSSSSSSSSNLRGNIKRRASTGRGSSGVTKKTLNIIKNKFKKDKGLKSFDQEVKNNISTSVKRSIGLRDSKKRKTGFLFEPLRNNFDNINKNDNNDNNNGVRNNNISNLPMLNSAENSSLHFKGGIADLDF